VNLDRLRRRHKPAAVEILVPRGHLADFARRRGRIAPRNVHVGDPLADASPPTA
jgi:hypothetical protein